MPRKTIFILFILFGSSLTLAAGTYWLDSLTSVEPLGIGQQILKWLTTLMSIGTWISAYVVNKKNNLNSINTEVSGGKPLIPVGDNARAVQVNNGNYIEKLEIKITPQTEEEIEKNKRKHELRNVHEFEAPKFLYKPIQESVTEFKEKLELIGSGYLGVFGPPGSAPAECQNLACSPVP